VSRVQVDSGTGSLVVDGAKVFPLILSNGPPIARLGDVASAGINMIRSGYRTWGPEIADGQIADELALHRKAASHGLHCWTWLGQLPNLPAKAGSPREQLLVKVVDGLKGSPGLGAWKGIDEPALGKVPPASLVRAHERLRELDPNHPLVLIQAPLGSVATLAPYAPALDVTGADIYPVSYPPGSHVGGKTTDISVVGDITARMVSAARGKPVWMTLQIAWSGVLPPHVPRFPTLLELRFMAYQAIVAGARGLAFFGGHLKQVMRPADARAGWNWTFWETTLRPLMTELSSTAVGPALVAPHGPPVRASAADVAVATRRAGAFLYVIAVRRKAATSVVQFTGLPDGAGAGEVLFEYDNGSFRDVTAKGGAFRDWLGPHDARVYRFKI
jgi:hypothetical protein